MACRCTRISKCRSDITKVSNARTALQALSNNNGTLNTRLTELGGRMQEMATPDNIGSCATSINNMNKDSASTISAMISQCTARISSLQSELTNLEREDREHHQGLKK